MDVGVELVLYGVKLLSIASSYSMDNKYYGNGYMLARSITDRFLVSPDGEVGGLNQG
jgi:hypothetical protein